MGNVQWIKLSIGMFDDEKIRLIEAMPESDSIIIVWIKLLIQAGKTNIDGYVILTENTPYSMEMLGTIFNRPIDIIDKALKIFEQLGMIEIDENQYISICNWEKHQNIKGLEKIRENNRLRKRKERVNKKLLGTPKCDGHMTVTQCHNTEEEIDIDKKRIRNNNNAAYSNEFEQFWLLYPRKVDKKKASKFFMAALKNHPLETILSGTKKYATQMKNTERKYIKHPAKFLDNESFVDGFEVKRGEDGFDETQSMAEKYNLDF